MADRFRRAAGGFSVIVIGVLVALAGDRWNESRQERRLEIEYLVSLVEDLVADSLMLESEIARTVLGEEAAEKVLLVLSGSSPESDLASVTWLDLVGPSAQPYSTSWTFEELRSTGNVRLIADGRLRRALFEHHGLAQFQRERMQYIQPRGRDPVSDLLWGRGADTNPNVTRSSLGNAGDGAASMHRLARYHRLRRQFLDTWRESANRALAAARFAAGS